MGLVWRLLLAEDTVWEAGLFKLQLDFSEEYPTKPPKVTFLSKVFHPNVYDNGQICLDILQNQWCAGVGTFGFDVPPKSDHQFFFEGSFPEEVLQVISARRKAFIGNVVVYPRGNSGSTTRRGRSSPCSFFQRPRI